MPPDGGTRAALDAVNALRHRYGAKAVTWDDQLYAGAHSWAQELARRDNGLHHGPVKDFSENLAMSLVGNSMYDTALSEGVRQWWADMPENNYKGEESIYFDPDQPDAPSDDWGHFANLVGKDHDKMAIAAKRGGAGWYVVLRMSGDFHLGAGKQYHDRPAP